METKLMQKIAVSLLLLTLNLNVLNLSAQSTAFTYQGRLNDGTNAATGIYDLRFTIYDSLSAGAAQAGPLTNAATSVSNGLFTVTLNFGESVFNGANRWLEIGTRTNGSGAFVVLAPRQPLTPTPYALYAQSVNATNLIGVVPPGSLSGVARLTGGNVFSGDQIVTNGNVGIGTVSPATRLEVAGTVTATSFIGNGSGLTGIVVANASQLTNGTVPAAALGNAWKIGGNTGVTPDDFHFLGNIDNQPLEFRVNNSRSLRLEPANVGGITGVNTIGGAARNYAPPDQVVGATIFGGGLNPAFSNSVVAFASFSTISGGSHNVALGQYAMIPGGLQNVATNYGFAAGRRAKALHLGAFVWADNTIADFASTGTNQFLIRASGGVAINANNPGTDALYVNGTARITGGFSGNVGIGTVNPLASIGYPFGWDGLHTRSSVNNGIIVIQGGVSGRLHLRADNNITNIAQDFIIANGANRIDFQWLGAGLGNRLLAMTIATNGNVGMGTVNPGALLHLVSANNPTIKLQSDGTDEVSGRMSMRQSNESGFDTYYDGGNAVDALVFESFSSGAPTTKAMVMKLNGNIGIGIDAPTTKLHVAGEITTTAINLTSDRNAKEQFKPISAREVLAKVTQLPISEWQYKANPETRHIGPMAQDFHAAFAVGRDDKHITSVDADGVRPGGHPGLERKTGGTGSR